MHGERKGSRIRQEASSHGLHARTDASTGQPPTALHNLRIVLECAGVVWVVIEAIDLAAALARVWW